MFVLMSFAFHFAARLGFAARFDFAARSRGAALRLAALRLRRTALRLANRGRGAVGLRCADRCTAMETTAEQAAAAAADATTTGAAEQPSVSGVLGHHHHAANQHREQCDNTYQTSIHRTLSPHSRGNQIAHPYARFQHSPPLGVAEPRSAVVTPLDRSADRPSTKLCKARQRPTDAQGCVIGYPGVDGCQSPFRKFW